MEGSGHRRAGITRCGNQDGQGLVRLAMHAGQARCEETRTEILERGGGAMEQLQHLVVGRSQGQQDAPGAGLQWQIL